MPGFSNQPAPRERTQLFLDSVPRPVTATVLRKSARRMRVRQPLPFLELQGGLSDAEGRRGRVGSVAVEYDGATPSLVLDVLYDGEDDGTLPYCTEGTLASPEMHDAGAPDYAPVVFRTPAIDPEEPRISSDRVTLYGGWEELGDRLKEVPTLLRCCLAFVRSSVLGAVDRSPPFESARSVQKPPLATESD